jgi:hypothetical protein
MLNAASGRVTACALGAHLISPWRVRYALNIPGGHDKSDEAQEMMTAGQSGSPLRFIDYSNCNSRVPNTSHRIGRGLTVHQPVRTCRVLRDCR